MIIVGAGISGLSAALDLGRGGAKVTVIDMSSVFGGHAVMSQGSVSIVATPAQTRAGIEDSAGINGKAALEGTFLGPCIITGRVAARSLWKELDVLTLLRKVRWIAEHRI